MNALPRSRNNAQRALALFLFFAVFILTTSSYANSLPNTLTVQGRISNSTNQSIPVNGTHAFVFTIYDSYTSGNALYQQTSSLDVDANGVYTTILSNINLSFSDQYYLGIKIDGDSEASPRINLSTSPYAFRANTSESLNQQNAYTVSQLTVSNDAYVSGNLQGSNATFQNLSVAFLQLGWANLTSFPAACPNGQFVTAIGATLTCQSQGAVSSEAGGWQNDSSTSFTYRHVLVDTDVLVVNATTNKVGINTAAPTEALDIVGNLKLSSSNAFINITGAIIRSSGQDIIISD